MNKPASTSVLAFIAIMILFAQNNALACQKMRWDYKTWVAHSTLAYEGILTAKSLPEVEKQILAKPEVPPDFQGDSKLVRVAIQKTVKGKSQQIVETELNWCRGGNADLGAKVLLVKFGDHWYMEPI